MKRKFLKSLCVLFGFSYYGHANGCEGLFPHNRLKIPVDKTKSITTEGLSEFQFKEVIDRFSKSASEIEGIGGFLKVNALWDSEKVNAKAYKEKDSYIIDVYGGLARFPQMSEEVLNLVLCHELGHHLGGAPFTSIGGDVSTEGQADYFSTTKCFKKTVSEKSQAEPKVIESEIIKNICKRFSNVELTSCYESLKASETLTQIYDSVAPKKIYPALSKKDQTVVNRTNFGYPSNQCRLDTLVSGAVDDKRPECWYKQ